MSGIICIHKSEIKVFDILNNKQHRDTIISLCHGPTLSVSTTPNYVQVFKVKNSKVVAKLEAAPSKEHSCGLDNCPH